MTTLTFDATPTPTEGIDLKHISLDKSKEAWPEYKDFNKHDMIESMQSPVPAPESDPKPHSN